MDIFFADDSSQKGAREGMGRVIAIGGIFVSDANLRPLEQEVTAIASEYGFPEGEEIKWSPGRNLWMRNNLQNERRHECLSRILEAAVARDVRAIVVCFDTARLYVDDTAAKQQCLKYLFERIHSDLQAREQIGIVVADRPGGGKTEEETFLAEFLLHLQEGTTYVVPERIALNVLTTPSHLIRHLQLADLVTGISTAMVCGYYDYAKALFPSVQKMMVRGTGGMIGGTGLKCWPDALANLYHWILGEPAVVRLKSRGGMIPSPALPYCTNEFAITK